MTKNLIILAGGASSRMKKSTSTEVSKDTLEQANTRSKALILLHNRPMLDYLLYNAKKAGLSHIYIVIGPDGNLFKSYFGTKNKGNHYNGLTISYATQHIPSNRQKPLGTADAIFQTLEQYPHLQEDSFLVCNCDNLYSVEAMTALRESRIPNAFINYNRSFLKYPEDRIARFALTKVDEDHFLEDIIEKPYIEEMDSYSDGEGVFRVSMNIFKFNGKLFFPFLRDCPLHPERQEKEIPTALLHMIQAHPKCTVAIPFSEHVPDLTSKEDISVMNAYLNANFTKFNWK